MNIDQENNIEKKQEKKNETSSPENTSKKKEIVRFPDWDILPPNRIINPRIKNNS